MRDSVETYLNYAEIHTEHYKLEQHHQVHHSIPAETRSNTIFFYIVIIELTILSMSDAGGLASPLYLLWTSRISIFSVLESCARVVTNLSNIRHIIFSQIFMISNRP